jgi:hypothetical protein
VRGGGSGHGRKPGGRDRRTGPFRRNRRPCGQQRGAVVLTPAPPDPAAGRSLESFAREIDEIAAARGTTRAELLSSLIAGLEERIAGDTAVLDLARRLEAADREPAGTAFDHAIDIVARGDGQRPWRGK